RGGQARELPPVRTVPGPSTLRKGCVVPLLSNGADVPAGLCGTSRRRTGSADVQQPPLALVPGGPDPLRTRTAWREQLGQGRPPEGPASIHLRGGRLVDRPQPPQPGPAGAP